MEYRYYLHTATGDLFKTLFVVYVFGWGVWWFILCILSLQNIKTQVWMLVLSVIFSSSSLLSPIAGT